MTIGCDRVTPQYGSGHQCWAVQIHFFHASLLVFLALPHRASLVAGFATQGFPGLWSRSLRTPLCAEWGGVGGTSDPPPSMKRKSGCCEPGTFQPTQKFFVGRKTHQVTSLFLGSWQWQRVGVIQLDGMRQRMFKTQFTAVSQPILGLGKGRYSEEEGPGELYGIPKVALSSHLAMEASKDCGEVVCTRLIHPPCDRI